MTDSQRRISASGHDITRLSAERLAELTEGLDPLERSVTCMAGTERPFTGQHHDNKAPGTYLCRVCGLPLFGGATKFDSGTGWPSFFAPVDAEHVLEQFDESHGMRRIEVVCARSGFHLGHVFEDGPRPTGRRFCINSAALRFVADGETLPPEAQPAVEGDRS